MIIDDLKSFINRAEKNRKYAQNSAIGARVALGYFEKELNEDEKESIEKFMANFDAIYANVIRKNQDKLSPGSLLVYKRRVSGLLKDYDSYASDPSKFVAWSQTRKINIKKKSKLEKANSAPTDKNNIEKDSNNSSEKEGVTKSEVPLRPGVKAVIWVPDELTPNDVEKIKLYIEYLGQLAKKS